MTISPFLSRRLLRSLFAFGIFVAFILIQQWQMPPKPIPTGTSVPGSVLTASSTAPTASEIQILYSGSTTRAVRALVVRAVDGDTLDVKIETTGEEAKIRLLGMNTPESVDPRRPVQCFGKEASHHMKDLVEGKVVLLIDDPKADERDKYGRWLRNVVRDEDRLDVNATLVAQGYANAYLSFPLDGKRKAQIRQLEQEAKANQRGLWSPTTCEGKK